MSDELSIEIIGSSGKAVNALDKLINKLAEYQNKLISTIPKMNQFNNILKNIPSGSGNRYKELANGITAVANSLKKFDNKTPLNSLKNELEMIKRSSLGLDVTAKKLTDVANTMTTTKGTSKISADLAKYQAQVDITNARVQSALAKTVYDTENYALKTQKLAEAKEKLAESERKVAEKLKWEEEAQKSLKDSIARFQQNQLKQLETLEKEVEIKVVPKIVSNIPKIPVDYKAQQLINQAQMDAFYRIDHPEFDNSKIKESLKEVDSFIQSLMPSIENLSVSAQNRFDSISKKLRVVNTELERQKQLYNSLNTDLKTLSQGGGFGTPISEDTKLQIGTKIQDSVDKIKQFTTESDRLKNSMKSLASPANNASNAIKKVGNSSEKASKGFNSFDRVIRNLKTYLLVGVINKVSQAFSGALSSAMNFTENMNLFNVSMGENVYKAGEFIDKMSSVFGMDSSNLVKTMGNFYQISHSMGVTSKNAYTLSENFTKLANDLSSFYNISVNDATVKSQAGLVGETEPLRRLGIIITENALKQTAANLGIEKSVRDMSEAEKMHLRYITVLNQTKNVQGDFARTIAEPAQLVKILQEQLSQLSRAIGSVFMPVLGAVLPYIIAFSKAITTLIVNLASVFGYKAPEYKSLSTGFSSAVDESDKLGDSVGNATKKAKEFQKLIMGFDELNILSEPKDTSGGGSGSGGAGSDFAVPDLTGYDNLMDSVNNRMNEIYQNIMSFFEGTGRLLEPTNQAFARLGEELDRLGKFAWQGLVDFYNLFLVPVGNWVFGEGLPRFIDALTFGLATIDYSKINNALGGLWTALTPFALSIGDGLLWFWENVLVPLGTWTMNNAVPTFLNLLTGTISFLTPIIEGIKPSIQWLFKDFLMPIATWTGGIICDVLNGIAEALKKVGNWMSENQGVISAMTTTVATFFAAWKITELMAFIQTSGGLSTVLKNLGKAIGDLTIKKIADRLETIQLTAMYAKDFIVSLAKGTVELGKQIAQWVVLTAAKVWDAVKTGILTAAQWLLNVAMSANPITLIIIGITALVAAFFILWEHCEGFRNFWIGLWDGTVSACQSAWNWLSSLFTEWIPNAFNVVVDFVKTNWQGLLLLLINPFAGAFKLIYDNCEGFRNFIDNLVAKVGEFFYNLWSGISNAAKICWDAVVGVWNVVSGWFNEKIIEPVSELFTNLWDGIKNTASNCWNGVVSVWNVVSGWFNTNIILPISNLFSGLWEGIKSIFSTVSSWFGSVFTNAYNAVTNAFSGVKNFFSGIWENIKTMFTNIGSTIGNAIGGAFKTVVNSIINFAQNTINSFLRAINSAIGLINLIPGVNINKITELNIPKLAKGGLATESIIANIGEGKDQEAVLPLNDAVFSKLAEGINKNNANNNPVISEESLYKAFLRALQDAPEKTATFVATLNNKIIAKEILKEGQIQDRRFNPVRV